MSKGMQWFRKKASKTDPGWQSQRSDEDSQSGLQSLTSTPYMLPKDFREMSRLDFQHYFMRQVMSGNYLAPLSQPRAVLDVACGTGRWMHEMALQFPQAQVVGVDVTLLSNEDFQKFPPNCSFRQCDILRGLPFAEQTFDFCHQRFLIFAVPFTSWPAILQEQIRITRSKGWIELTDSDLQFHNPGPETVKALQWISLACEQRGMDVRIGRKLGALIQTAGLMNVTVRRFSIPIGTWGGRIGDILAKNFSGALTTLKPLVTTLAHVSEEEFGRAADTWLKECNVYQTSCDFYVVFGQRP